jgi:pyruvate-formate lyase-activating enzyme
MGFRIGLHTGGAYPRRFADVLPLVDWVGFDIKARFAEYRRITEIRGSGDRALASAILLLGSGVDHEFRTTVHPLQHDSPGLQRMAKDLGELGVRNYVLQDFRADGCADTTLGKNPPISFLTESWCLAIAPRFASFTVRRA